MSDRRFSLVVSILGLVFVGGVYVDGWAHNHDRVDDSFFTPWHGLLYATYLVVAAVMLARVLKTHRTGTTWRAAVPDGYALSLVGVALFLAAGIGDMVWHTLFGVEEDLAALLSPTHLMLASSGVLMGTGPYLAGMRAPGRGWRGAAPVVLTSLALMSFVAFMTQYINPYSELWPTRRWLLYNPSADELGEVLGAAGFVWYSVVLAGFVLVLASRDRLPVGAAGLLVAGGAALSVTQGDDYWVAVPALIGAVMLEGVLALTRNRRFAFRVLSAAVAGIPIAVHMAVLAMFKEMMWPVHLWAGTPVIAALVGMLVGLAVVPPGERPRAATGV